MPLTVTIEARNSDEHRVLANDRVLALVQRFSSDNQWGLFDSQGRSISEDRWPTPLAAANSLFRITATS